MNFQEVGVVASTEQFVISLHSKHFWSFKTNKHISVPFLEVFTHEFVFVF